MNITLLANRKKWLEAEIVAGRFSSPDEALAIAVSGPMDLESGHLGPGPRAYQARAGRHCRLSGW